MKVLSTRFVKGIIQNDPVLADGIPQVAFVGRSNVGKSSLINALTKSNISKTSSSAGSTQQINFFLINNSLYFVDLPGYGFARASNEMRSNISTLIDSYLFNTTYVQKKIVLIIDINVGMTDKDITMFQDLLKVGKDVVVALSKVDKVNQSTFHTKIKEIQKITKDTPLFPYSSKKMTGIEELVAEILK